MQRLLIPIVVRSCDRMLDIFCVTFFTRRGVCTTFRVFMGTQDLSLDIIFNDIIYNQYNLPQYLKYVQWMDLKIMITLYNTR